MGYPSERQPESTVALPGVAGRLFADARADMQAAHVPSPSGAGTACSMVPHALQEWDACDLVSALVTKSLERISNSRHPDTGIDLGVPHHQSIALRVPCVRVQPMMIPGSR